MATIHLDSEKASRRMWPMGMAVIAVAVLVALLSYLHRHRQLASGKNEQPAPGSVAMDDVSLAKHRAAVRGYQIPHLVGAPESKPRRFTPRSFETFFAQDKYAKDFQRPVDLFNKEVRDPVWAPAMEKELGARFSSQVLESLKIRSLTVDQMECRSSSCRFEISWDEHDHLDVKQRSSSGSLDPLSLIATEFGPFGAVQSRAPLSPGEMKVPFTWETKRRPDGRFATTQIVLFGEDDIDPNDYQEFYGKAHASMPKPGSSLVQ